MAIVVQQIVEGRRFSGWLDPRYPIGYWFGAKTLTGDASGGVLGIDLLFQPANGPERLNSQMYSVERISITTDDDTNRDMQVRAVNMGGPANEGFQQAYTVLVDTVGGIGGASSVRADTLSMLPWFLGAQRLAGITAALSLLSDNVDTIVYTFEAEGYRWSPRSVLVDGGPQRPPTGLYPR